MSRLFLAQARVRNHGYERSWLGVTVPVSGETIPAYKTTKKQQVGVCGLVRV